MTNDVLDEQQTGDVVVGFFEDAEQAQGAIFELRDEGFGPSQVGAAFHSLSGSGSNSGSVSSGDQGEGEETPDGIHVPYRKQPGTTGLGSGASGVRSDDVAVTPAGLAYGSGTLNAGPGRPGPITGTASVKRVLHGESDPYREIESSYTGPAEGTAPATGSFSQGEAADSRVAARGESGASDWWGKLKEFFGADDTGKKSAGSYGSTGTRSSGIASGTVNESSMNFGTGEGHLGVTAPAPARSSDGGLYESQTQGGSEERLIDNDDYTPISPRSDYSGGELEGSFYGMGVSQDRARRLSQQISRGGAIVTVKAGGRGAEAEQILERNGARVRHEQSSSASSSFSGEGQGDVAYDQSPGQNRVVLFGEVLRVHRDRFAEGTGTEERKAS